MRLTTLSLAVGLLLALPATAQVKTDQPDKPDGLEVLDAGPYAAYASRAAAVRVPPVLSENFNDVENGAIPAGWTRFEAGAGAGQQWQVVPFTNAAQGKIARVIFEDVPAGSQAIDYLVTPQVSVEAGFEVRAFLAQNFNNPFGSTYEIRVSTGGNDAAADFTDVLASYTEADLATLANGGTNVRLSLDAYAGMDIYIAFVHINDNGDVFYVDDVVVGEAPMPIADLDEDFDDVQSGRLPMGWTRFEAGTGPVNGQQWVVLGFTDPSLGKIARSRFENVPDGGQAMDYLVTPQVSVGTDRDLTAFLAQDFAEDFGSTFEIRVSTGDNDGADDFTDVLASYTEADLATLANGGTNVRLSLDAYAGMDIYIAFVHIQDDGDSFFVDDVVVAPAPTGPLLTASAASVSFGQVPDGTTQTQTVTITNTGDDTLVLSIPEITGDLEAFSASIAGTALSLEPGESTTFDVTFTPREVGTFSAQITVASNATVGSPAVITVTGQRFARPGNDALADAAEISAPGRFSGTNAFGTTEDGELTASCAPNSGASVFYTFTPSEDTDVFFDFSDSDFGPVVSVYDEDGDEVACFDREAFLVVDDLEGGETYTVRVAGFAEAAGDPSDEGDFAFDVFEFEAADEPVSSRFARANDGSTTFSRPFTDGDGTAGSCATRTDAQAYDAVTVTVSATGPYTVTADWDGYDGYLLLYGGPFDPAQPCRNLIGRDDDFDLGDGEGALGGSQIESAFLDQGGTYTIVATTFSAGATGGYELSVVGNGAVNFPVSTEGSAAEFALGPVYPNPSAGAFRLAVTLAGPEAVRASVYDALGREVAVVHDGPLGAGETVLEAAGLSLPAGRYLVRVEGESFGETRSLTVVR